MADRFLYGQVDDLDVFTLKELKRFMYYFREKFLEIVGDFKE